ncbi:MAG: Fe-S oxidoreductase containing radical domain [Herbinix sp.]|jgi:radical SAM protein with 4Fe4S-binding SPASM domain|nr:Fe-S oxidoreductase containing radical domain [Herbinix sp.]
MKAKNENLVNMNRSKLQDVIPLSTPYTIAIDPCNLCNFKCEFCAMHASDEKQDFKKQNMPLDLFKKIIDDLSEFPQKLKVLRINGQGEPLINIHLPEMIAYAKKKNIADFIEIITNGSLLQPDLNRKLVQSGLHRIRISVEAVDEEGYLDLSKAKIDFNKFRDNIRDLYENKGKCEIYVKIVDVAVPTEEDKQKFFALFGDICDRIFIDNVIPLWSDFNELEENFQLKTQLGVHGQVVKNVNVCPFPFYSFLINPEGQVTACCADWKRKLVIGDVSKEKLINIWNGQILNKLWINMLEGNMKNYEMCKKCLLPSYDCNDNIDEFTDVILKNLELKKGENNEVW